MAEPRKKQNISIAMNIEKAMAEKIYFQDKGCYGNTVFKSEFLPTLHDLPENKVLILPVLKTYQAADRNLKKEL